MSRTRETKIFHAKTWRTKHLVPAAEHDLETLLFALTGDKEIEFTHGEYPIKGYDFTPPHKVACRMGEWVATGYTKAGAISRMLALMLDGAYTPLT